MKSCGNICIISDCNRKASFFADNSRIHGFCNNHISIIALSDIDIPCLICNAYIKCLQFLPNREKISKEDISLENKKHITRPAVEDSKTVTINTEEYKTPEKNDFSTNKGRDVNKKPMKCNFERCNSVNASPACNNHSFCPRHIENDEIRFGKFCKLCKCVCQDKPMGAYYMKCGKRKCRNCVEDINCCFKCCMEGRIQEECKHYLCDNHYSVEEMCFCVPCKICGVNRAKRRECGHLVCAMCEVDQDCTSCITGQCNYCNQIKPLYVFICGEHLYCKDCYYFSSDCRLCSETCERCGNLYSKKEKTNSCEHKLCQKCLEIVCDHCNKRNCIVCMNKRMRNCNHKVCEKCYRALRCSVCKFRKCDGCHVENIENQLKSICGYHNLCKGCSIKNCTQCNQLVCKVCISTSATCRHRICNICFKIGCLKCKKDRALKNCDECTKLFFMTERPNICNHNLCPKCLKNVCDGCRKNDCIICMKKRGSAYSHKVCEQCYYNFGFSVSKLKKCDGCSDESLEDYLLSICTKHYFCQKCLIKTCSQCDNLICSICIINSPSCKHEVCSKCFEKGCLKCEEFRVIRNCDRCNEKYIMNEKQHNCQHGLCLKCLESICDNCGKKKCIICMKKCGDCSHKVCMECYNSRKCPVCKFRKCNECFDEYLEDQLKCACSKHYLCQKCSTKICSQCNESVCIVCVSNCIHGVCKKCFEKGCSKCELLKRKTCDGCGDMFTMKKKSNKCWHNLCLNCLNKVCDGCGKVNCIVCMKIDSRKCSHNVCKQCYNSLRCSVCIYRACDGCNVEYIKNQLKSICGDHYFCEICSRETCKQCNELICMVCKSRSLYCDHEVCSKCFEKGCLKCEELEKKVCFNCKSYCKEIAKPCGHKVCGNLSHDSYGCYICSYNEICKLCYRIGERCIHNFCNLCIMSYRACDCQTGDCKRCLIVKSGCECKKGNCEKCSKNCLVAKSQFSSNYYCVNCYNLDQCPIICSECKAIQSATHLLCVHNKCYTCLSMKKCPECICDSCGQPNNTKKFECGHTLCNLCGITDKCKICFDIYKCTQCEKIDFDEINSCVHNICKNCISKGCKECLELCVQCKTKTNVNKCPHNICENYKPGCSKCILISEAPQLNKDLLASLSEKSLENDKSGNSESILIETPQLSKSLSENLGEKFLENDKKCKNCTEFKNEQLCQHSYCSKCRNLRNCECKCLCCGSNREFRTLLCEHLACKNSIIKNSCSNCYKQKCNRCSRSSNDKLLNYCKLHRTCKNCFVPNFCPECNFKCNKCNKVFMRSEDLCTHSNCFNCLSKNSRLCPCQNEFSIIIASESKEESKNSSKKGVAEETKTTVKKPNFFKRFFKMIRGNKN